MFIPRASFYKVPFSKTILLLKIFFFLFYEKESFEIFSAKAADETNDVKLSTFLLFALKQWPRVEDAIS